MRKDDGTVTFSCDQRDLATAAKFFVEQGVRPRTRSELVKMIVHEYALALVANQATEFVDTAMAAEEIIKSLFSVGVNPQGRLERTLLINKQVDSGVTPATLTRTVKKHSEKKLEQVTMPDPEEMMLQAAIEMLNTGKFIKMTSEKIDFLFLLEKHGRVAPGTTRQARELLASRAAKDNEDQNKAAESTEVTVSTESEEERAKRDKEQLERERQAFSVKPKDVIVE